MTSPGLKGAIHAAIRAARAWGTLLMEEREIEHMTRHQEKVPWCEYCWPAGIHG